MTIKPTQAMLDLAAELKRRKKKFTQKEINPNQLCADVVLVGWEAGRMTVKRYRQTLRRRLIKIAALCIRYVQWLDDYEPTFLNRKGRKS